MAAKSRGARRAGSKLSAGEKTVEAGNAARAGTPEANVPPTRQGGILSATGQAVHNALGLETKVKGKDRGAPAPKDAVDPLEKAPKPKGLQKEKAIFSSNGEIPLNMQASPSGLVPIAAGSPKEQAERVETRKEEHKRFVETRSTGRDKRVSDATIDRLGGAELRAIASQRGYTMPEIGGNRTMRTAFAKAQSEDKGLGKEEV